MNRDFKAQPLNYNLRIDGDFQKKKLCETKEQKKCFFSVTGMTCSTCVTTLDNCLNNIDGISSAKVSLMMHKAEVIFDPTIINTDRIIAEVECIGFKCVLTNDDIDRRKMLLEISNISLDDEAQKKLREVILSEQGILTVSIEEHKINTDSYTIQFECNLETKVRSIIKKIKDFIKSPTAIFCIRDGGSGDLEARRRDLIQQQKCEVDEWKTKFLISMIFTIPCLIITWISPYFDIVNHCLSRLVYPPYHLTLRTFILFILTTSMLLSVGLTFYRSAYKSIRHGVANMDVLIALASISAYIYSIISILLIFFYFNWPGKVFFDTTAMLISIVSFGRFIENKAKGQTSSEISKLMTLQPQFSNLLHLDKNGDLLEEEKIETALLQLNDVVRVKPGERIPADGDILKGKTNIDEVVMTGESLPVYKKEGSFVIGGTVNLDKVIDFKVTGVGSETTLARIVNLVNYTQLNKAPVQILSDRIASIFVPFVIFISFLTLIIWYALLETKIIPQSYVPEGTGNFIFSIMFSISVLVISCPCSLGLATPTAVMVGTMVGAKHGIFYKGGEPLELCGKIDAVMFDKTGTLTMGQPTINSNETHLFHEKINFSVFELWQLMAAAEIKSGHILGRCIVKYVYKRFKTKSKLRLQEPSEFESIVGRGIMAIIDERRILIGNQLWLSENSIFISDKELDLLAKIRDRGNIGVLCSIDKTCVAIISISDQLRSDARDTVDALQKMGIHVSMITGDNRTSALHNAKLLGIPTENVFAQVKPSQKADIVASFQESRNISMEACNLNRIHEMKPMKVMFVGDGINDSPALAKSDVGMTIGHCTHIASETASIICATPKLANILVAIDLSRCTLRRIFFNYGWALLYNSLAIPFAAGLFYPLVHISVHPAIAAALMGFTSLSVVLSSLWLKRYKPPTLKNNSIKKHLYIESNQVNSGIKSCHKQFESKIF